MKGKMIVVEEVERLVKSCVLRAIAGLQLMRAQTRKANGHFFDFPCAALRFNRRASARAEDADPQHTHTYLPVLQFLPLASSQLSSEKIP